MQLATFRADDGEHFGIFLVDRYLALDSVGDPDLRAARAFLAAGERGLRRIALLLAGPERDRLPAFSPEQVRLLPPVPRPGKVICVGRNYSEHCSEQGRRPPGEPILFAKFAASLTAHGEQVLLPPQSQQVDFEAELAVVIGRECDRVPAKRALDHVGGYAAFNDISARDLQARDKQWVRAKSFRTFGPFGPHLVTPDEVGDPQGLRISMHLNDRLMQEASTAQMIFPVAELVSFISQVVRLDPGDVIATGTPSGVGAFRDPPVFLAPGDRMRVTIEAVGVLENDVEATPSPNAEA
jgi:2-keto-4-pentenoate hydratase/2-oxohepta-3-ene-1,7-dioic acid hydratase in catechol pathway